MMSQKIPVPEEDQTVQNQNQDQGQAGNQDQVQTGQIDATTEWLTYTDSQKIFSFKYPANFGANVWSPTQWPPVAVLVDAGQDPVKAGCGEIHDDTGKVPAGTAGKTDMGLAYTMYAGSDAGAGQLYSSYCYVFERGTGGAAAVNFVIKSHTACGFGGCGAYCGTQYEAECTNLNRKAAIEDPIAKMAATFTFDEGNTVTANTTAETPIPVLVPAQYSNGRIVTLADNQANVALAAGDIFLLKLDENYDWSSTVVDNSVVDREKNNAVIKGTQGIYRALKIGDTDLTAIGEPVCRNSTPPCAMPSVFFTVHVAVR